MAVQREKLDAHPLFERISDEELESDPAAALLTQGTEEGQKVARNEGKTWRAVYRRLEAPQQQQEQQEAQQEAQQGQQQQQQGGEGQ